MGAQTASLNASVAKLEAERDEYVKVRSVCCVFWVYFIYFY